MTGCISRTLPVFGSRWPTKFENCAVNHISPFRSKVIVCGSLRGRIRHRIDRALSSCWVEPPDSGVAVAGEPDLSRPIDDEIVGIRPVLDLVALERPSRWVEVGDVVAFLTNEPDAALTVEVRIAWACLFPGDCPLRHLERRFGRPLRRGQRRDYGKDQDGEEQGSHGTHPDLEGPLSIWRGP